MNARRTVDTTMWLMIFVATIGSVDLPGQGPRKLPAPRQYVAIIALWSVLGIVADAASAGIARATAALAWLVVLAAMVLGPAGQRFTSLLGGISHLFPTVETTSTASLPEGTILA